MNHAMFEAHMHRAKREWEKGMNEIAHSPTEDAILDCLEEIIAALQAAHE